MMWTPKNIRIDFVDDLVDQGIVTAAITTPAGTVEVMASVVEDGMVLILSGLHIHGRDVGPRQFGANRLFAVVLALMLELEVYDEVVILGAPRTSGAGKGHRPRPIRFTRAALLRHFASREP